MDTKGIISNALRTLLKRKKIDDITVQNILDEAHVSRSTFYSHFADKYDLMAWYYKSWLEALPARDDLHYFFPNLTASLQFIKDNSAYFNKVLQSTESTALEDLIFSHSYDVYFVYYKKYLGLDSLTKKNILKIRLMCHGSTGLACHWIRGGCAEPPELISGIITEMLPDELKQFDLGYQKP